MRQGRSSALMLNIPPTSTRSQFNNLVFLFPSSSRVHYVCVSDVRQTLEAPHKEKHKKNKEKHKTKKEHRRRKEKVSTFWVSQDRRQALVSLLLSCRQAPPLGAPGPLHTWQKGWHSCKPSICKNFQTEYFSYSVVLRTVFLWTLKSRQKGHWNTLE